MFCNTKSMSEAVHHLANKPAIKVLSLQSLLPPSQFSFAEAKAIDMIVETMLNARQIEDFQLHKLMMYRAHAEKFSEILSAHIGLSRFSITNVTVDSQRTARLIGGALAKRFSSSNFKLSMSQSSQEFFEPFLNASAAIGGSFQVKDVDLHGLQTVKFMKRLAFNGSKIIELQLKNITGLSELSQLCLSKGVRNLPNLVGINLQGTKCSPGTLITLQESLRIILKTSVTKKFSLLLGDTDMNDACLMKVIELLQETSKIRRICFDNFETPAGKRLICTRIVPDPNLTFIYWQQVKLTDTKDFDLLLSGIKRRSRSVKLLLSPDSLNYPQKTKLNNVAATTNRIRYL